MGYSTSDRLLGSLYNEHIKHIIPPGGKQPLTPDATVDEARNYYTRYFGVRIMNQDDMVALEAGTAPYLAIPTNAGQPQTAAERAVALKQTYFPESLRFWDETNFSKFPYVADIPNPIPGLPVMETIAAVQPSKALSDIIIAETAGANKPATTDQSGPVVNQADNASWLKKYWYIPVGVLVLVGLAFVIVRKSD